MTSLPINVVFGTCKIPFASVSSFGAFFKCASCIFSSHSKNHNYNTQFVYGLQWIAEMPKVKWNHVAFTQRTLKPGLWKSGSFQPKCLAEQIKQLYRKSIDRQSNKFYGMQLNDLYRQRLRKAKKRVLQPKRASLYTWLVSQNANLHQHNSGKTHFFEHISVARNTS